jgi:hypothetical protein
VFTIYRKAGQHGYAPEYGLNRPVPPGMISRGVSTLVDKDGEITREWHKTKLEGLAPEDVITMPDPKRVVKVSTLYDGSGMVQQQWVSERPEDQARQLAWVEAAKAFAEKLEPIDPIFPPDKTVAALMACYPIGDHHLGMLSWDKETGADWDINIAESSLASGVDYLVKSTPACGQATVVFLGDFMHYDSFESVTPQSRNLLDADGRYPKMVRAAIRAMRRAIDTVASYHGAVNVIVEFGNHDMSSSIFLMECLDAIYENNSRVTIDTSPKHFHYFEWGKCLVGTHHGHSVKKAEKLGHIMAADQPEAWGRTKYRFWWTGHIHRMTATDLPGVSVESFRVLPPQDAWSHQMGYRAERDMKAIVLHREFGEVSRHTVNPDMFV